MSNDEPFELLRRLGKGGFAETFAAQVIDEDLRHEYGVAQVALKIPHDRKAERALKKDVELGALLHLRLKEIQAQNLVRYLGFENFRNQIVMVMELEEGNLRGLMGHPPRQLMLPVPDVLRLVEDVLKGLVVIHGEQVVHRDIKPENILLRGRVAKITDFGISRLLQADQNASTIIGTPPYMSPEMLSEVGASFSTDIWSLGVMTFEMLTGQLPFRGQSIRPLVNRICTEPPPSPRSLRPDLSAALEEFVLKALEKSPADRYESAEEMLAALRALTQRQVEPRVAAEIAAIRDLMEQPDRGPDVEARLRALAKSYPDEPAVLQQLGEFLGRSQRHGDAIVTFQRALVMDPTNGLMHWQLALAFQSAGQKTKAAEALQQAIALDLDPSLKRHATMLLKAFSSSRTTRG